MIGSLFKIKTVGTSSQQLVGCACRKMQAARELNLKERVIEKEGKHDNVGRNEK